MLRYRLDSGCTRCWQEILLTNNLASQKVAGEQTKKTLTFSFTMFCYVAQESDVLSKSIRICSSDSHEVENQVINFLRINALINIFL